MNDTLVRIKAGGIIAVLRGCGTEESIEVTSHLLRGGITCIEVTVDSPDAFQTIEEIKKRWEETVVGAGTVLENQSAEHAIRAGAEFIVSPVYEPALIQSVISKDVCVIPGTMTPSEMYSAYQEGAEAVKFFPASVMGARFIEKVQGPLPDIPIIPTGGIDQDNAEKFLRAGAFAVGIGSYFTADKLIQEDQYDVIETRAEHMMEMVETVQEAS